MSKYGMIGYVIVVCGTIWMATSPVHAAGTPEQRRACRTDAMKFCRQYIPNVKRITACMEHNVSKLSPLCRKQFR